MAKLPKLRRKLSLETRADVPDGGGGFVRGWLKLGDVWAEVTASSGQEIVAEARQDRRVTHRVKIRWSKYGGLPRPRSDQRFRDSNGVVYNIRAPFDKDGTNRWLNCLCEEGEPA